MRARWLGGASEATRAAHGALDEFLSEIAGGALPSIPIRGAPGFDDLAGWLGFDEHYYKVAFDLTGTLGSAPISCPAAKNSPPTPTPIKPPPYRALMHALAQS